MGKKIILVLILLVGVIGYLNMDRIMRYFRNDSRTVNTSEVKILIPNEISQSELIELLISNNVIENGEEFREYTQDFNVDTSDFAAGKFIILSGTKISDLVDGFTKNEEGQGKAEVKVNVVFNRCKTIEDVASNISKCIAADSTSLIETIQSNDVLSKYGFTLEQIPALFIPDTYQMYYDTDAKGFIAFMAEQFKDFWNADRYARLKSVGLSSPSEAVTVASIVFSEQSRMAEEWPIISKLYLNRLEQGIRLQSDPTFKFCWGDKLDGVERLLNKHKKIDCPYNTYLYDGLPPGPICIPPAKVVDAVLNPANVNFIFMCGKPGGTGHNFAVTNAQHERNVAEYRFWLKEYLKNK